MIKQIGILSIVTLQILVGCNNPQREQENTKSNIMESIAYHESEKVKDKKVASDKGEIDWVDYTASAFHFTLEMPNTWKVDETKNSKDATVLTMYSSGYDLVANPPFDFIEYPKITYITVHPQGSSLPKLLGSKINLQGWNKDLPVDFQLNKDSSMVYILNTGEPWAYLLKPSNPPKGWSENGYIFVHMGVSDFLARCFDVNGKPKSTHDFDMSTGDKMTYYGDVKEADKKIVQHAVSSLYFFNGRGTRQDIAQLIQVDWPQPNDTISSPITIKGKARGDWYFEGNFPVVLKNEDQKVLSEKPAKAKAKWMTKKWVPFEITIDYDKPNRNQGFLVLKKANASGKPENDRNLSIPVVFSAKE
ncbi:Gmad2 immunoglobulin-like domain-containing protein [Fulvivirga sediminis]|uniref:Gmad2 immunoglobulin-like domain-containing protein n=1 Tax=Fulvivirga sediminis TaxID=2803949 RepID=A0A937K2S6_9BACT|nr:Gmad2 immunoglobulin-like domain-containing protein [Fulvivirga sediminis]MBL3658152.1 Gmad2 immunoglobulin-like domain-containing protein [Fulvivirga sediminis]